MNMEIEISKEELVQLMQGDCKQQRFSDWQINFAIENAKMTDHPRYIEYMKHFGFNMFQIRYLIKLFSK